MSGLVTAVFCLTYMGMALGRLPGLAVDRTGIALIGITILIASGALPLSEAARAVDLPTIILLFALMIVSAQFQGSGFYDLCARAVTSSAQHPARLLALLIGVTGLLSALLTNDVVVFALTPLICQGLLARGLDPRPYLIALAGAANAGSAATLIGNPQNILIGQVGQIDFWRFAAICTPVAIASLAIVYATVRLTWAAALAQKPRPSTAAAPAEADRFQIGKGFAGLVLLVALFATDIPREVSALGIAGIMLLSRRISSRNLLQLVDWPLLLLFLALFGITAAFAQTGLAAAALGWAAERNLTPAQLPVLAPLALLLSNTIGNVPAVILLTTLLPDLSEQTLIALSLLSTLAGNLLLTGSIANIIVAERASRAGVGLSFSDFAHSGIPMTLASFAVALIWLYALL
ncbi:SLC13 family permease [Rhodoligotrophos defluvii]|uniref:SLC13 family permease n=1 Tax=Rhodoligotrophos defluvii TaxID=2561934 RepID=UPI00195FD321|nr:SLC13 family permease [Rhodoligotrophos defluvii]